MKQSQIKRIGRYKVRTIDVHAKEWFDHSAGNSYHSAVVHVNYGMPSQNTIFVPFQYGYGSAYLDSALKALGWDNPTTHLSLICGQCGIIFRSSIERDCKKREVIAWGAES
jgi:hypothetical protein